jgi:hypothetical protein
MAVYPNHRYVFGSPARFTGGAAPGYEFPHQGGTARRNRFVNPHWSSVAGGDRTLLPGTAGALAAFHAKTASCTLSTPALLAGRSMDALPLAVSVQAAGTLSPEARLSGQTSLGLTVSAACPGRMQKVAGQTTVTVQVTGGLSAQGALQGTGTAQGTLLGTVRGTGGLRAHLVPYPELSVENFVVRVEETLGPRLDTLDVKLTNATALAALG